MEAPKWTDIAIVILTGGIVLLAYMQWREMHGAGKQTDDLIKAASVQALAATKNAEAADKFAATAAHMDTKIDATEKDFQQIANRAGESLRNTQESFRNDQRAWVGVSNQTVGVFNPTLFDPRRSTRSALDDKSPTLCDLQPHGNFCGRLGFLP
jgi:hypothetical protein